jgi:hypothetical protein
MFQGQDRAQEAATAVQTATIKACEVCGAVLRGGQAVACSDKCRAERWRQRRSQALRARDREIAEALAGQIRRLGFQVTLREDEP